MIHRLLHHDIIMIIVDSGLNTGNLAHSMGIDKVSKKQYNYIHFSPVLPNANTFPLPPLFGVERICFHFPPCFSNDASCLMVNIEWTPLILLIINACSYAYNIHTFKTALADRRY